MPFLALSVGADESAVDVEDGLGEEVGGLLRPDPQSRLIDGVHQVTTSASEKRRQKSPSVVGSGSRSSAQGVEINLIVASQFDVFDRFPPAKMLNAMFRTWSDS